MKYIKPQDYALELSKYKKNIFSQNGEDGIIEFLINMLNIKSSNNWCCEFGAWDGKKFSNTYNLILNKNWKSVLIESDKKRFEDLKITRKNLSNPSNVLIYNEMIHYLPKKGKTLDNILSKTSIPKDFDILSIDVDGPDYHIWKSLTNYQPKIVIIEHSGLSKYIIQREGAIHKKEQDGSTSFLPMRELGISKGYVLLVDTGNLIFLRKDLYMKIGGIE